MLALWAAFVGYAAVLTGIAVYALRCGGRDERFGALALIAAVAASQVASLAGARWREGVEYGVLAVDAGFLAALLLLVHRSRKFWPLWACAAQLVGTLTHGIRLAEPGLAYGVYVAIQPFWVFPVLGAIAVGTFRERRAA